MLWGAFGLMRSAAGYSEVLWVLRREVQCCRVLWIVMKCFMYCTALHCTALHCTASVPSVTYQTPINVITNLT